MTSVLFELSLDICFHDILFQCVFDTGGMALSDTDNRWTHCFVFKFTNRNNNRKRKGLQKDYAGLMLSTSLSEKQCLFCVRMYVSLYIRQKNVCVLTYLHFQQKKKTQTERSLTGTLSTKCFELPYPVQYEFVQAEILMLLSVKSSRRITAMSHLMT